MSSTAEARAGAGMQRARRGAPAGHRGRGECRAGSLGRKGRKRGPGAWLRQSGQTAADCASQSGFAKRIKCRTMLVEKGVDTSGAPGCGGGICGSCRTAASGALTIFEAALTGASAGALKGGGGDKAAAGRAQQLSSAVGLAESTARLWGGAALGYAGLAQHRANRSKTQHARSRGAR